MEEGNQGKKEGVDEGSQGKLGRKRRKEGRKARNAIKKGRKSRKISMILDKGGPEKRDEI